MTMSNKPIFVATHPRACSTAFERVSCAVELLFYREAVPLTVSLYQVFMTRRDTLRCVHEPFGDAFYFGPERLSDRYEKDETARLDSGFSKSTFKTILERIDSENTEVGLPVLGAIALHFQSFSQISNIRLVVCSPPAIKSHSSLIDLHLRFSPVTCRFYAFLFSSLIFAPDSSHRYPRAIPIVPPTDRSSTCRRPLATPFSFNVSSSTDRTSPWFA